jgi:hypothetical protein
MESKSGVAPDGVEVGVQLVLRIQAGDPLAEEEFEERRTLRFRRACAVI